MFRLTVQVCLLFSIAYFTNAEKLHLHLQPDLVIADYHGPLHKDVLQLFKGAETLEIINSNITQLDGHMISELPLLKKLVLDHCTVDSAGVNVENMLHGAVNLKEFYARHIFSDPLYPEVIRTTNLEAFALTDSPNYKTIHANTFNETKLKSLELSRNHLETIEEGALNGLDNLETLDLDTNKLKNVPKAVLVPLKSIKTIKLRENLLERFSTEDLPELPHLEFVDLGYNPLKKFSLEKVEAVAPKLKTIDLTGVSLPATQVTELKAKYPNISLKTE